jgi:valyl-tRNA synthetase
MNLEGDAARGSGATDMTDARRASDLALEDRWILDQLSLAVRQVHQGLADYNPAAALHAVREFFWSALCDWYLELIKPRVQDAADASGGVARQVLAFCLDQTLRLLHPFIPFITEHLWQRLGELVPARGLGPLAEAPASEQLIGAAWPQPLPELEDAELRARFADLQALTRAVREVRQTRGLPPRQPLKVTLRPPADRAEALRDQARAVVARLAAIEELVVDPEAARKPGSASKVMGDLTIFVHDVIDDDAERERLQQALQKAEKEIGTCEKKLGNPKFVERAPAEVVQEQRERLAEYQAARAAILESLGQLGG